MNQWNTDRGKLRCKAAAAVHGQRGEPSSAPGALAELRTVVAAGGRDVGEGRLPALLHIAQIPAPSRHRTVYGRVQAMRGKGGDLANPLAFENVVAEDSTSRHPSGKGPQPGERLSMRRYLWSCTHIARCPAALLGAGPARLRRQSVRRPWGVGTTLHSHEHRRKPVAAPLDISLIVLVEVVCMCSVCTEDGAGEPMAVHISLQPWAAAQCSSHGGVSAVPRPPT